MNNKEPNLLFASANYSGGGDYYKKDFDDLSQLNHILWEVNSCEAELTRAGLDYILNKYGGYEATVDFFLEHSIVDEFKTKKEMENFLKYMEDRVLLYEKLI